MARAYPAKNIYIDIEGVILTRGGLPAAHLEQFLKYILSNYRVFWLTTRCSGDIKYTLEYLGKFVPAEIIPLLSKIRPTRFSIDKTEAINFGDEFYWLDDEIFASEKNVLDKHNKYDSWIEIDLMKNPNQLAHLIHNKLYYS
ncbi:hypothetical protein HY024_04740 [Candidatus Curtissbacteria bacterium]|nr:hypothetical protein [Candidatus Curtissbacteria bacterium]